MVVLDATVLLLVLDPRARPPLDPGTGQPVDRAADRIAALIDRLSKDVEKIVIPTPALSEVLVYADQAMQHYLEILDKGSCFRIAAFGQKAAIEAAVATRDAIRRGGRRVDADPDSTVAKIKFDRQIVAIAKAEGARAVYSDDDDVVRYARQAGLEASRTADLPLPSEDPQGDLLFQPPCLARRRRRAMPPPNPVMCPEGLKSHHKVVIPAKAGTSTVVRALPAGGALCVLPQPSRRPSRFALSRE